MANQLPPTPSCLEYNPRIPNAYGYQPSLAAGVIFIALFAISAATHIYQAYRYRRIWLLLFAMGAFCESFGWIARLLSHSCAYDVGYFKWQIAVLITAPAFTQAGIYAILWIMVLFMGRHTLPFPPKFYILASLQVDSTCLALQATGGGMAGAAFGKKTSTVTGTDIMVAGIVAQLVSTLVFTSLLALAIYRGFSTIRSSKHLQRLTGATLIAVMCMIARGTYRSIELLQGWRGYLLTHERYTIILDGLTMLLAVAIFNFFNPAALVAKAEAATQVPYPQKLSGPQLSEWQLLEPVGRERELNTLPGEA